jgi:hypothetical protein
MIVVNESKQQKKKIGATDSMNNISVCNSMIEETK